MYRKGEVDRKLSDEDVRLIRELVKERDTLLRVRYRLENELLHARAQLRQLSDAAIARKFNVHPVTVYSIRKKRLHGDIR